MKIYTRTGDDGTTGLFGGARVPKDDPRVEAYGTVDELNSLLGVARSAGLPEVVDRLLAVVQEDLFVVGSELATVLGKETKLPMDLLGADGAGRLEGAIDDLEAALPALQTFILPGGTVGAATLHLARTVCRRAERRVLAASRGSAVRQEVVVYLNRLSDYLFVAARHANRSAGVADIPWAPRRA